jgi:hypothetical protein
LATFGIVDETRHRIVTVEAVTSTQALAKFKAGGYIGHGRLYTVEPLAEAPAAVHFGRAAEIAREGRK